MATKRHKPEEIVRLRCLSGKARRVWTRSVRCALPSRPTISMDGSPVARCDGEVGCVNPLQTSIRRQLAGARAPKWGIRMRAPLQLVGLKGRDKNQARRAPVRFRRSISSSSCNQRLNLQAAAR